LHSVQPVKQLPAAAFAEGAILSRSAVANVISWPGLLATFSTFMSNLSRVFTVSPFLVSPFEAFSVIAKIWCDT
jgi:hypothetical protein